LLLGHSGLSSQWAMKKQASPCNHLNGSVNTSVKVR
jgi:hypothetical protein